jgi:hypothetical protein
MPFDTSMYLQNPLRTVADYQDQYTRADLNALAVQQGRARADEYQRGLQEQAQVRNLLSQTKTPEEAITVLRSAGFVTQADAIEKGMVARRVQESTSAETAAKTKALDIKTRHDLLTFGIQSLQAAATPDQARQKINEGVTKGYWSMQEAQQRAQEVPNDPIQYESWRQSALREILAAKDQLPKVQTVNMGGTENVISTDIFGKPTTTGTFAKTQTPDSVASVNATLRGQNMTDARAQGVQVNDSGGPSQAAFVKQFGKPSPGYRWKADGSAEAIPGGPADIKQQGMLTQDTQVLSNTSNSLDRLATAANEVLNSPGLAGVYGLRGAVPNIPGSDAANSAALLNTLKSQVGFGVLQEMRNNSKTGGALGQVSDKENAMLQANLAALEKSQSVEQARQSLAKIIEYTNGAKDRLRAAYNMKHGESGGAPTPKKTVVRTGTSNGRKVIQYSDGSIDYAD